MMLAFFVFGLISLVSLASAQRPPGSSFGIAGINATYDYVVVGGGTAGLVIATRLAQDGRYSVAVLEAGGFANIDNGNKTAIPGYRFQSAGPTLAGVNPQIDWRFMTVPQTGGGGKSFHYTRGKTLGGSSARNALVCQRPPVGALQAWADAVDDQSWAWSNVFKYYKRSTTFQPPNNDIRIANSTPSYDVDDYGDGPANIGYPNYVSALASWTCKALEEIGLALQPGALVDGKLLGYAFTPVSLNGKTQERTTSQQYMDLALNETDLMVYTHALVTKINFGSDKTAQSLQVETSGVPYTIFAKNEIILSAGVFQSPQLLMVSGIGPAESLKNLNIPVVADRPGVGQNLQDNPLFGISFPVDIETTSTYNLNTSRYAQAVQDYNEKREGLLTSGGPEVLSFHKASTFANLSAAAQQDLATFPDDWPDVQILDAASYLGPKPGALQPDSNYYASLLASLTAPLSRGTVALATSSMYDAPIIDPRWLTHPTDQELAVAAVNRMREIESTKAMQTIITGPEQVPGANVTSYEDILAAVQTQSTVFYHASGTCKMGLLNDTMAVVDSKAKVIGVNNLRIVDLGAIPRLPPGQPQATVYMIAEKMADEILYGYS